MVRGLNLGEPKLNSLFAKISFGMKVKGHGNPSWLGSSHEVAGKTANNVPLNDHYQPLKQFSFFGQYLALRLS